MIPAGLVLTGGGSKMEGVVELAEEILHMPVRLGAPQGVTGSVGSGQQPDPRHWRGPADLRQPIRRLAPGPLGRGSEGLWERIKNWFQGEF
jgi:cell division protein FtsA